MNQALFLDRDGVIIENQPNYVRSLDDVIFIPQALEALRELSASPVKIFFVTNQSAVGRGSITLQTVMEIHRHILSVIQASGGRVDDSFICTHAPQDACSCRKPEPGLFLQAAERYQVNLTHSICIGDAISDLQAAENAGVGLRILVRTGRGNEQLKIAAAANIAPFLVFDSLAEAILHFPPAYHSKSL
jgi:D-glycero-D-manno-heptose 1,7-bisphosphate phosphatase